MCTKCFARIPQESLRIHYHQIPIHLLCEVRINFWNIASSNCAVPNRRVRYFLRVPSCVLFCEIRNWRRIPLWWSGGTTQSHTHMGTSQNWDTQWMRPWGGPATFLFLCSDGSQLFSPKLYNRFHLSANNFFYPHWLPLAKGNERKTSCIIGKLSGRVKRYFWGRKAWRLNQYFLCIALLCKLTVLNWMSLEGKGI